MTTPEGQTAKPGYGVRGGWRLLTGEPPWLQGLDLPSPFAIELIATEAEIDVFGHVNNTVYTRWIEACAWAHSSAVGLTPEACQALNRGMALRRLETEFERPAFVGQRVIIANWVTDVGRLRAVRRFQILDGDGKTLARSIGRYVCIELSTGAPVRMPPAFALGYVLTLPEGNAGAIELMV